MKRFYYSVPGTNVFGVIHAVSQVDALHQFINSSHAPLYGRVTWMVGMESSSCEKPVSKSLAVTVHD